MELAKSAFVLPSAQKDLDGKLGLMAAEMAQVFGMVMPSWGKRFGIELVLNGLLDLVVSLICTTYPREQVPHYLKAVMMRISDTDIDRHLARHNQGKLAIAKPIIIKPG